MGFFKSVIDVVALKSDRPIRRLVAYYALLALVFLALFSVFPQMSMVFSGERLDELSSAPQVLTDGLAPGATEDNAVTLPSQVQLGLSTLLTVLGTLVLMLPVSWVYMSSRKSRVHDQTIAQSLLIMPIVVAGIIIVVQNSLALAFSLAGVVAAVRFRTKLDETRDTVFIFLAIAVGFAAGVQELMVGAVISACFNFALLLIWHYDFGRNALEPTAAAQWKEPLKDLALKGAEGVPDRDLAMALTPDKAETLADRFTRIHELLGSEDRKPRYNAILHMSAKSSEEAQKRVEPVLEKVAKRWKLDEVVNNEGKPDQLYYLVRLKKTASSADLITAVRTRAGDRVSGVDVEVTDELAKAGTNGKNGKNGKHEKNGKKE